MLKSGYIRSNIHWLCTHNIQSVYCVCSAVRLVVASSFLFPLLCLSLISGSIRNTARSKGKHTQTNSPNLARRVYVGWSDNISLLHCLHRATLHLTNTEKTHRKYSPQTFTLAFYFSFICNWEASATLGAHLFLKVNYTEEGFFFLCFLI